MKFISQRCINVNRGASSEEKKPKRAKLETNQGKHQYLDDAQSIVIDDEVSFERNIKKLSAEMQKSNPSSDILDSLMMQTFANRRKSILESRITVSEICDKYPLLRKPKHVSEVF